MSQFNKSRMYTNEEIILKFIDTLHNLPGAWRLLKEDNYSSNEVLFSLLSIIDGSDLVLPAFKLIPIVDKNEHDDIGGELHSLFLRPIKELNQFLAEGKISKTAYSFITKMQELAITCNRDMIILEVLKIIDTGMTDGDGNQITFKLIPISSQEDNDYFREEGENFYPLDAPNISGQLATYYSSLYPTDTTDPIEKKQAL